MGVGDERDSCKTVFVRFTTLSSVNSQCVVPVHVDSPRSFR